MVPVTLLGDSRPGTAERGGRAWCAGSRDTVCVLMSVSTPDGEPPAGAQLRSAVRVQFAPAAVSPEQRGVCVQGGGVPSPRRAVTQFAHQGKGGAMTTPNLFAEHTEGLEGKVVFNVSSKPRVIILWPLLFLRLFCWPGSRARAQAIKSRLCRRPSPPAQFSRGGEGEDPGGAKPARTEPLPPN